jgi:hypothetical protein
MMEQINAVSRPALVTELIKRHPKMKNNGKTHSR